MGIYFRKEFSRYEIEYNIEDKILTIKDKYDDENKILMTEFDTDKTIIQLTNILNEAIKLEALLKGKE